MIKSRRDKCKRRATHITLAGGRKIWVASKRCLKFHGILQKVYSKRGEQTKTFLYTIANRLCRDYDLVAIGDYTPRGGGLSREMMRALNNESLIGRFIDVLP